MARRQLLALGFSETAIKHRLSTGRLHRLMPGVYSVGPPRLTNGQRWMAAVLACEGAALSHRSALALWGIGTERPGVIDVSVRRRCKGRRAGVRVHGRPTLAARDIVERDGIPVTGPVRTLLDVATDLTPRRLERAVNDADKLDFVDPEELRAKLDDHAGEPGVKPLRTLLDRLTFRLSDDELELLFRPIAAAAGLPVPLTKQWVNDFEVDFFWPQLGLVVETDGLRYHRTASAQARDRLRDQTHTAAGLTQLRFTHHQVKHEPRYVRSILAKTAARIGGRADSSPNG